MHDVSLLQREQAKSCREAGTQACRASPAARGSAALRAGVAACHGGHTPKHSPRELRLWTEALTVPGPGLGVLTRPCRTTQGRRPAKKEDLYAFLREAHSAELWKQREELCVVLGQASQTNCKSGGLGTQHRPALPAPRGGGLQRALPGWQGTANEQGRKFPEILQGGCGRVSVSPFEKSGLSSAHDD